MAIIKNFKNNVTFTPNSIINNQKLTLKAVGLWTYLNSKPEDWNFSVKGTVSQKSDGRDSVSSGMKELESHGYLKRVPKQNNNGKWDGYDYKLYDEPNTEKDVVGKSVDVEPVEHSNTYLSNKELSNKNEETLFSVDPISKDILKVLNQVKESKIDFKSIPSNLKDIESRIKEGFTIEDFKKVIYSKVSEWKDNDKMKSYIRPATLFGSKFNGYLVESQSGNSSTVGSNNFKLNPQSKAQLL